MRDLNPKFWNGLKLRPEVRVKLLQNAVAFKKFMNAPGLKIDDVLLVGSSASRWWTKHSDIDIHLIVDFKNSACPKWADGFFSAQKSLWNQTHDVTIYGHVVEVYVEDADKPATSASAYSLVDDKWLREPGAGPMREDDPAVIAKADALQSEIEDLLAGDPTKETVEEILLRLKRLRKDGLDADGEKSTENWAYKTLRNRGVLYNLWSARKRLVDDELSLNERMAPGILELWEEVAVLSPAQRLVKEFTPAHGMEVKLEVLGPEEVQLVWIERKEAEKGAGGDELEALCDLANNLRVKISLTVSDHSLALVDFYRSFGFKSLYRTDDGDVIMERPALANRRPKSNLVPRSKRGNFVKPWKRRG